VRIVPLGYVTSVVLTARCSSQLRKFEGMFEAQAAFLARPAGSPEMKRSPVRPSCPTTQVTELMMYE
jgi:hypothetical protein